MAQPDEMASAPTANIGIAGRDTRLVAVTDPRGLAAEKFRALVTRLENYRKEHDLRSLQVTSTVSKEGRNASDRNLAIKLRGIPAPVFSSLKGISIAQLSQHCLD